MLSPVLNGTPPRILHVHEVRETNINASGRYLPLAFIFVTLPPPLMGCFQTTTLLRGKRK